MNTFLAPVGSMPCHKRPRSARGLWLWLIAAILAFSLIAVPATRAIAYQDGGALPSVGSIDDYMSEGQPRDRAYAPQGPYQGPYQGSYMDPRSQGFYGAPTGSRSQMSPAFMGAMIALWALERYQQRHQRHRYAMRNNRGSGRHRRSLNPGNPTLSPFGYGF